MGKPRRQTYTLEMYLKKLKDQDIRQDQDVQRLSDQWSNSMMNELIITVLNDGYIPPVILGQEENSQMWVVDGLQRSTTLMKFRYGSYKITISVEAPIITYRAKVKDSDGEIMLDGNGDIVWEDSGQTLPSVDNLYRLSRLFDMHMEDLLVERKTESGME